MLLRSTGKAKEGYCLFIKEELHKKVINYLTMGLWGRMPNIKGAKIVEMSAYAPLITATAIDYIQIPMENIFVLKDQKSSCYKKAIVVKSEDVKHTRMVKDFSAFEKDVNAYGLTFYKKTAKKNSELKYIGRSREELAEYGIDIDLCPKKAAIYYK